MGRSTVGRDQAAIVSEPREFPARTFDLMAGHERSFGSRRERKASRMVSPVGIDNGKARPKAEAVLLMTSGRIIGGRRPRIGEPGRNRTYNQQIKSLLLCQLSYGPWPYCLSVRELAERSRSWRPNMSNRIAFSELTQKFITSGLYLRNWSQRTARTYGQAFGSFSRFQEVGRLRRFGLPDLADADVGDCPDCLIRASALTRR
jgi:hypothetical protein